ncbi:MAG: Xaa-Pro aminopeptidase [Gammaproteobacteria bacterium]|nr:Xaa-Pro aminopeptidase [Gammaproteobacteria bacterium]
MIKMTEYAKRRSQLMQKIGPTGIVILPSSPIAQRNGDYDYPYRQQSDLYYLTGFNEAESVAVFAPKRAEGEFVLFNRPKDREREIWDGIRAGQAGACETYGADQAFPISDLANKLPELLEGRTEIHYALGLDKAFDKALMSALNKLRGKIRNGQQTPLCFKDITDTIHEMRLIKSIGEIELMRQAAQISAQAHVRAMQHCKPGVNEYQLEAEIMYEFNRHGARFPAYTSIVGGGANSCILHYINNDQPIVAGDLVLIDAGAEFHNYAADITRTFPANGIFSAEQRAIYELVLEAQLAGIKAAHTGAEWPAMQDAIVKVITQGLIDLGILKGNLNDLIETQAYFPFYMHKSGHWLGLDVHDVGRYKINGKWRTLQPGMVLTVEPGIYISADTPNVDKRWHNIGIRIEDDILITTEGHEVLSHHVPKSIEDIENLMAKS